jgi:outer membrane immunogenic protein
MKKLFLATTAFVVLVAASAGAADMSARPGYAPPPAAPLPVYTWTGMYWGANVGYSWGKESNTATLFGTSISENQNLDGVIGGIQTGFNYQFGAWVWGLETDIQASGQKGSTTYSLLPVPATTLLAEHKLPWFGTSRVRLGILATPSFMLYGTGGVAFGQVKDDYTTTVAGVPAATVVASIKDLRAGWTAGAGIEGALGGGWSAKLEYLYFDLGELQQTVTTAAGPVVSFNSRLTDNIVRVGLNYRWGGAGY